MWTTAPTIQTSASVKPSCRKAKVTIVLADVVAKARREEQQRRVEQGGTADGKPIGVTRLGPGEMPKAEPTFANTGVDLSGVTPRGSANLFISGRAARMGIPGGVGQNLTTITAPNGTKLQVNAEAAPHFQAFLNDLAATGYKINDISLLAIRPKRWAAACPNMPMATPSILIRVRIRVTVRKRICRRTFRTSRRVTA
jgi:hypothetical protein